MKLSVDWVNVGEYEVNNRFIVYVPASVQIGLWIVYTLLEGLFTVTKLGRGVFVIVIEADSVVEGRVKVDSPLPLVTL